MADQAKALSYSVSTISAIELGSRSIPDGYPAEVGRWLNLSNLEAEELEKLAIGELTVVQISPADNDRAQLAFDFARDLNSMPIEQIRRLRKQLAMARGKRHSVDELRSWALLARSCFELGNKLTFSLLEVLENRIPLIDSEFSLEVESNYKLGDQLAAYADSVDNLVKRIVLSEHIYDGAYRQTPDAQYMAAHELAHWLIHPGQNPFSTPGQRFKYDPEEVEADLFARELLLPKEIVGQFLTPGQLAMVCNVPLRIARLRMKELATISREDERTRVSAGFAKLIERLDSKSENLAAKSQSSSAPLIVPISNDNVELKRYQKSVIDHEKFNPKLMLEALGFYAGHRQIDADAPDKKIYRQIVSLPNRSRADSWYSEFGWR